MNLKNKIVILLGITVLFSIGFKKVIDYQDYNPTIIVEDHKFNNDQNIELLNGNKVTKNFIANNNNLGSISIIFNNHNRINDDYLQFKIQEIGSNDWYYNGKYKVDQFPNNQYFPFGFPPIIDSKNKQYQIEIESLDGTETNSVQMVTKNSFFLSKYSFPKAYLLQNKKEIPIFILSKIGSYLDHIGLEVFLSVFVISLSSFYLLRFVNINKLLERIKTLENIDINGSKSFFKRLNENKLIKKILVMACLIGLFVINLVINGPIRLKTLAFSDDLGSWDFFNTNRDNFWGFIFNTWANKFRPVFNSAFFSLFYLFGNNTWLFGVFNIIFSFLIAVILFLLFRKISKSTFVSFCLSVAFILSRFAYYDITQALGLMEAMSLLLSVFILYLLWRYLNTENIKYFWESLIIFVMLIFTHERFITLLGVYFVTFIVLGLKRKNILLFLLSTLPVILSFILKIFVLNIRPLDGTGGTDILQTFNISGFLQFFMSGWFYLFGVNAGPAYLNGIPSEGVSQNINTLILIGNICLLLIVIFFGFLVLKSKKILSNDCVKNFILFFSFIFSTLIAASVTFRLEMRWLYVPFVGLLFLLAYMSRIILKKHIFTLPFFLIFLIWFSVYIPREIFYRSYYKNLYYWGTQTFGNALYEATLEKYGDDFWNYKTYIVCADKTSSFMLGCSEHGDLNLLFRQFEQKGNKANLYLISKVSKIPPVTNYNKLLVLRYDQQQGKFVDFKVGDELYKK